MSDKERADKAQAEILFEGTHGRRPDTDQELENWLASPEGRAAIAFELTAFSAWGERARS